MVRLAKAVLIGMIVTVILWAVLSGVLGFLGSGFEMEGFLSEAVIGLKNTFRFHLWFEPNTDYVEGNIWRGLSSFDEPEKTRLS